MSAPSSYASERPGPPSSAPAMTGWVGFVVFGGIMLVLLGLFHLLQGIIALGDDDYYVAARTDLALQWTYQTWGWVHLVIGVIGVGTGTGIFLGRLWARVLGVLIALISAFTSMAFLPALPIWSTVLIALDVLVIYALIVHGGEVRT